MAKFNSGLCPGYRDVPALCQPKDMFLVAGFLATHRANSEIQKEAKSLNICAASVMMARELAKYPPEGSG